MTTTYSAFFSSGLLAPPHLHSKSLTPPSSPGLLPSSPGLLPSSPGVTRGSSPMADDSDIEDLDITMDADDTRVHTPTPSVVGERSRSGSVASTAQQGQRPRLRKRRSSLNIGTSVMNTIKSPHRNADNALHLQQRLPPLPTGSVGRSRSGSLGFLGFGALSTAQSSEAPNGAPQATSFIGRMRSGSVGGGSIANIFRPRRAVRRLASVPAPAPPPTAPLPALPADATKHTKSNSLFHNTSIFSNPKTIFSQVVNNRAPLVQRTDPPATSAKSTGRPRAQSCIKGVTFGTPIDEEMKEN